MKKIIQILLFLVFVTTIQPKTNKVMSGAWIYNAGKFYSTGNTDEVSFMKFDKKFNSLDLILYLAPVSMIRIKGISYYCENNICQFKNNQGKKIMKLQIVNEKQLKLVDPPIVTEDQMYFKVGDPKKLVPFFPKDSIFKRDKELEDVVKDLKIYI